MRGHPVFIAQHATATCCRGCLAKWHDIPAGRALTTGAALCGAGDPSLAGAPDEFIWRNNAFIRAGYA
jgi:hypothetical protein